MALKINDKVKYFFPNPVNDKVYINGFISFIGETKIEIICEDMSRLRISFNNFKRIIKNEAETTSVCAVV